MSALIPWLYTFFAVLIGVAYLGVGATVVRAAKPTAGYLLIGAGALEILTTCCNMIAYRVVEIDYGGVANIGLMLLGTLQTALTGVLIAVAAVMLANAVRALDAPG